MPTVNAVIASYKENLSWVDDCPDNWSVFVYAKGNPSSLPSRKVFVTELENVGREAHAFAYHNSRVAAADYTVFLQGDPFDHDPHAIETATRCMNRLDWVGWMGCRFDTRQNGPPYTPNCLSLWGVYGTLFEGGHPDRLVFPAGAQLVVRKNAVAFRSQQFWSRLERMLATPDARMPHAMERLWPVVYDEYTQERQAWR